MQEQDIEKTEKRRHRSFQEYMIRGDKVIWGIYIFLFILSMLEIFSATSQLANKSSSVTAPAFKHIEFLFGGLVLLLFAQSLSRRALKSWDKIIYFLGFVLTIVTIFFGVEQKGASRSFAGIQPVELCKIGIVMILATAITASDAIFARIRLFRKNIELYRVWFYIILIGIVAVPIATQNLSSGLIIGMTSLAIMFIGRVSGKYLWIALLWAGLLGGLFFAGLYGVYLSNKEGLENVESATESKASKWSLVNLVDRSSTWASRIYGHSEIPLWEEDINGKKSQELCARMAIANSYPMGRSLGRSKLRDFLPEAFSDYIFAIIFEEWGVVGALIVLLAYLALFARCYQLSIRTEDMYLRLLILGLALIMVIQALIHIGVCTGAMFVTGQPLPLISRGGSSILGTSISFGIILAVSRLIQQEQTNKQQTVLAEPAGE